MPSGGGGRSEWEAESAPEAESQSRAEGAMMIISVGE